MSGMSPPPALPQSILDTDLYKLSMQQAVLSHFPTAEATYRFTHRDEDVFFSRQCIAQFTNAVPQFASLALTLDELTWLKATCPYLKPHYLEYLAAYRFKPEQVSITFIPHSADGEMGKVEIEAKGPWVETIFWEVPLMACLSETFFRTVDTDWDYDAQADIAYEKAKALLEAGCMFSEFGTRRRRSYYIQDLVVETLVQASKDLPGKGKVSGTSNVHLAHRYGITPVGTIAHEWFMGVAALKGYENANSTALDLWENVYPNDLLLALTDTFSSEGFFKNFTSDPDRARRWKGLRQDSGDPFAFGPRAKKVYESLGIDHHDKIIVYSDALNLEKALGLQKQCAELGFIPSFGIGTFLTNDFHTVSSRGSVKSKALNMVIKLAAVDGKHCVKISDDLNKNTGDPETVTTVKKIFNLPV